MRYIKDQLKRLKKAFGDFNFWVVMVLTIPLSMLGIWWPVFFNWDSYNSIWMPASWFTFGLGTLSVLSIEKLFSSDDDDSYKGANSIVIVACSILGCLFYGKALQYELNEHSLRVLLDTEFLKLDILELAIILNLFVWFWHCISKNCYNNDSASNALGG
uniref:hypothetical protein n=1 Tax=Vibrio anguillarum TaxID=55601 RepID=UPI00404813BE